MMAFVIKSILLGAGLAMDAFSVSMVNGLSNSCMRRHKMVLIAGTFAFFQAIMPLTGWICVQTIVTLFESFEKCIPFIALALLGYIGGKMLYEGIKNEESSCEGNKLGFFTLMMQGVATSIDALSVGFTIADYDWLHATICALIIALVTYILCMIGVMVGKKFGSGLSGKANILGGIILIAIGIEIFVSGVLL